MEEAIQVSPHIGYYGQERRAQQRREPINLEERGWRLLNLALAGSDQRGSFGRRANDYALLSDQRH